MKMDGSIFCLKTFAVPNKRRLTLQYMSHKLQHNMHHQLLRTALLMDLQLQKGF